MDEKSSPQTPNPHRCRRRRREEISTRAPLRDEAVIIQRLMNVEAEKSEWRPLFYDNCCPLVAAAAVFEMTERYVKGKIARQDSARQTDLCNYMLARTVLAARRVLGHLHYSKRTSPPRLKMTERLIVNRQPRQGWRVMVMTMAERAIECIAGGADGNALRAVGRALRVAASVGGCGSLEFSRHRPQPLLVVETVLQAAAIAARNFYRPKELHTIFSVLIFMHRIPRSCGERIMEWCGKAVAGRNGRKGSPKRSGCEEGEDQLSLAKKRIGRRDGDGSNIDQ